MARILIHNAVKIKPKHLYWIDRWGNVYEEPLGSVKLTLLEKLKCKWIDLSRWLDE